MHLDKKCRYGRAINPPDVPIFLLFNACSKVAQLGYFVHNFILGVGNVENELWIVVVCPI